MTRDQLDAALEFLAGKQVSPEDLGKVAAMLTPMLAQDDPPPTQGTPVSPNDPGAPRLHAYAPEQAQDAATRLAGHKRGVRAFAERFPDAPRPRHLA